MKKFLMIALVSLVSSQALDIEYYCYNGHSLYIGKINETNRIIAPDRSVAGYRDGKFIYSLNDKVSGIFINKKIYDKKGKPVAMCFRGNI